jgi:hypothetical protein
MWKRLSFVCVCLLFLGGPSFALNINDLIRGGIQKGMREATLFEWRKLPTAELACIDQNLHRQGWSIDALAIQGIGPPDSRLAQLRADCRNQFAQIPQGNPAAAPRP